MDIYEEITAFYESVPTEKTVIGKSWFHRNIYAVKKGSSRPVGIVQCAIHAREKSSAYLAIEQYLYGRITGSCWFIPLMNPDGALLTEQGVLSAAENKREFLTALQPNGDFSLWKANGRGVDLNVNFNAGFGKGRQNVFSPASENYVGGYPCSEAETKALRAFTNKIRPDYTVSYHTKGEEIYFEYGQTGKRLERDLFLANLIAETTGYRIKKTTDSHGGYKDWCILKHKIPSFTIEVGSDDLIHPISKDDMYPSLEKNRQVIEILSKGLTI